MITIREILPQFIMFGRNRHRINSSLSRGVEPATQMWHGLAFYVHLLAGSSSYHFFCFYLHAPEKGENNLLDHAGIEPSLLARHAIYYTISSRAKVLFQRPFPPTVIQSRTSLNSEQQQKISLRIRFCSSSNFYEQPGNGCSSGEIAFYNWDLHYFPFC